VNKLQPVPYPVNAELCVRIKLGEVDLHLRRLVGNVRKYHPADDQSRFTTQQPQALHVTLTCAQRQNKPGTQNSPFIGELPISPEMVVPSAHFPVRLPSPVAYVVLGSSKPKLFLFKTVTKQNCSFLMIVVSKCCISSDKKDHYHNVMKTI